MTGGFEPVHATFPLARRPRRILTPVIEIATLVVFHPSQHLTFSRAVALQLIRDDHPRDVLQPLEKIAKKHLRRLLVAAALHQDVEHVIVLVDRSPQVITLAMDGQNHPVEMPMVSEPGPTTSQPIGVGLAEFAPLTDRFVDHHDPTFE
jgi:hypothetical protein